jgi:hypothetical protein
VRLVPNLADEFGQLSAEYDSVDQQGKDMIALVKMFGDEYDHLRREEEPDFGGAWTKFLDEHKHQLNVAPMTGLVLYFLITYWDMGPMLYDALPTLEKMLIRDTVQEISAEINRRSAQYGNAVIPE